MTKNNQTARKTSPMIPVVPNGKKAKSEKDPIATLMAQIAKYESELELVESKFPAFYQKMHEVLSPYRSQFADLYKEAIAWLGQEYAKPKGSRKHKERIIDFALALAERAQENYDIDLQKELAAAGFGEEILDMKNDPDFIEFESAYTKELVDRMFEDLGVNPPDFVRQGMYQASLSGEDPPEDVQAWFNEQTPGRQSEPPRKKKKTKSNVDAADPESLKKQLYHGLARDIHPDKASDDEREQRTQLMQQLNTAYHEGNISALLKLLHVHGSEQMKAGVDPQAMQLLKKELERQKNQLRMKVQQKLEEFPPLNVNWINVLSVPALQKLVIKQEEQSTKAQVMRLKQRIQLIQKPKELELFFKQIPSEICGDYF